MESQEDLSTEDYSPTYSLSDESSVSENVARATSPNSTNEAQELEETDQALDYSMNSTDADEIQIHNESETGEINEITDEPPAKMAKLNDLSDEEDNDGSMCSICFDSFSNTGEHRLVALKCGHLFGFMCIRKWFRNQRTYEKSCPTCKRRASLKDLRFIYARKLIAVDVTELQACKKMLAIAKEEKTKVEEELQKALFNQQLHLRQIKDLRTTIKQLESSYNRTPDARPLRKRHYPIETNNIEVCPINIRPIKVMFRTKDYITMQPMAIFKRMQRFNPGLKVDLWKVVHRRLEEGGQRLIIYIDRESAEVIKKSGFGAYTGVDRGFFRFLKE